MPLKSELQPTQKRKVIDLVRDAGIDVSDWANFPGGKARAAANPRYCYEWSFVEPKKVAVLNLWFEQMQTRGQDIVFDLNFREYSDARGERNQERVKLAIREKLPIRIIVLDGKMGNPKGSIVSQRQLDPAIWRVTTLDQNTGDYILTRGAHHFIDQFSIQETPDRKPERRGVSGLAYVRRQIVRYNVLLRANGKCEWCDQPGFPTAGGGIYLETHHVIPLSEDGLDTETNVAALCPNHHREAHHGKIKGEIRKKLLERLGTRSR
jgi:5-methylcytosine-specific restriction enzyme A